jgi:hypothetical protein
MLLLKVWHAVLSVCSQTAGHCLYHIGPNHHGSFNFSSNACTTLHLLCSSDALQLLLSYVLGQKRRLDWIATLGVPKWHTGEP